MIVGRTMKSDWEAQWESMTLDDLFALRDQDVFNRFRKRLRGARQFTPAVSYSQNAELGALVVRVLTTRHDPRREQIAAGIGALRL
jgi:hypothetical protein